MSKNKKYSDAGSLTDVKRELRRAGLADAVSVRLALHNFWRPLVIWRAVKFVFLNQRRKRLLVRLVKARMGFNWRCALPKKKQRQLGLLPKLS